MIGPFGGEKNGAFAPPPQLQMLITKLRLPNSHYIYFIELLPMHVMKADQNLLQVY